MFAQNALQHVFELETILARVSWDVVVELFEGAFDMRTKSCPSQVGRGHPTGQMDDQRISKPVCVVRNR